MMMSSHEQPMTTIARASSEAQAILSPSAVASTFDDHEAELETQSETEVAKKKARGKSKARGKKGQKNKKGGKKKQSKRKGKNR